MRMVGDKVKLDIPHYSMPGSAYQGFIDSKKPDKFTPDELA